MVIPTTLQVVIDLAYKKMMEDTHKSLLPRDRLPIYKTLDILLSDLTSDINSRLAIITTQHILAIWQQEVPNDNLCQRILKTSSELLEKKVNLNEIQEDVDFFYLATGSEYYEESVSPKAYYALKTAYTTLCIVLGGKPFEEISPIQIQQGFPDELMSSPRADAASPAVIAYSGQAYDVGALDNVMLIGDNVPIIMEKYKKTFHAEFDPIRRQEFWEWWLTEAIPQAWELAQQSTS